MDELSLWKIIVLAIVQGITEFLPISSDGHLLIAQKLLCGGREPDLGLTIVLHMGTLLSIFVFYWSRIWELLLKDRWTIVTIIVGTIPAVLIGLPAKKFGEQILENLLLAGVGLLLTGGLLLFLKSRPAGQTEYQRFSLGQAFLIGLFQAAAILPGLSRSGSTIASGVGIGLTRASAATFSFLLAIPVIAGAGVLEAKSILLDGESLGIPAAHLATGMIVSFVVGLVSLWALNRWLAKGQLHYLAWYCFALGIAVIVWQLRG